jgi:hypothetical protein
MLGEANEHPTLVVIRVLYSSQNSLVYCTLECISRHDTSHITIRQSPRLAYYNMHGVPHPAERHRQPYLL